MPSLAGPLRLIPLEGIATAEVSHAALRLAARCGRLRAVRGDDRFWHSTRRWVNEYLAQRYECLKRPRLSPD